MRSLLIALTAVIGLSFASEAFAGHVITYRDGKWIYTYVPDYPQPCPYAPPQPYYPTYYPYHPYYHPHYYHPVRKPTRHHHHRNHGCH